MMRAFGGSSRGPGMPTHTHLDGVHPSLSWGLPEGLVEVTLWGVKDLLSPHNLSEPTSAPGRMEGTTSYGEHTACRMDMRSVETMALVPASCLLCWQIQRPWASLCSAPSNDCLEHCPQSHKPHDPQPRSLPDSPELLFLLGFLEKEIQDKSW